MAYEKKQAFQVIDEKAPLIREVADKIWDNPETAFTEFVSAETLCTALEGEGFKVERGVAGIETAFTGTFGHGKPVIGILGEFDALAGLSQVAGIDKKEALVAGANGHGCGHNLLGAGSLAAAIAVKDYLKETGAEGTVIFYGTPGEEGGSGKAFMAREGVFDELDAAVTWHPASMNIGPAGCHSAPHRGGAVQLRHSRGPRRRAPHRAPDPPDPGRARPSRQAAELQVRGL